MPTYEYVCKKCDHQFDAVQSFSEDAMTVCPKCGGPLNKKFGSVGVVFKGSGFYRTDSREEKRASKEQAKADGGGGKSGDGGKTGDGAKSGDGGSRTVVAANRPMQPAARPATEAAARPRRGAPTPNQPRPVRRPSPLWKRAARKVSSHLISPGANRSLQTVTKFDALHQNAPPLGHVHRRWRRGARLGDVASAERTTQQRCF